LVVVLVGGVLCGWVWVVLWGVVGGGWWVVYGGPWYRCSVYGSHVGFEGVSGFVGLV